MKIVGKHIWSGKRRRTLEGKEKKNKDIKDILQRGRNSKVYKMSPTKTVWSS
jgi:hypothetical protein